MNIIGYKKVYLTLSVLMMAASIAAVFAFGFKQGIDFVGGTAWQVSFQEEVLADSLNNFLTGQRLENVLVRPGSASGDFSIRTREISEERHQELAAAMRAELGEFEELSFSSIGPAIGRELREKALFAFGLVLVGISLYIAFVFRKVSYPVSSWKYGFITLVTLFHDAIIATGFLALLGWWRGAELDTNFIVAILVIMGFSVHQI
jgi:preprotein translocase subunit SecF